MAIPDFQSLFLPLLQFLSDGQEHSLRDATEALADTFNLTEGERQELIPSGTNRQIVNRVGWAKTYLKEAGLLESVRRGVIRITHVGQQLLTENPVRIDMKFLERYPAFVQFRDRGKRGLGKQDVQVTTEEATKTPEELMDASYALLREALADELLQQVKVSSDSFFEHLVVKLLVAMGYGGSIEDAGKAVGKTGDGGIDGVIKEDRLGLDVVVIQAKKWSDNQVGRPAVQAFAGSMEAYRASKGVFIATTTFSEPAREYVKQIQRRIVLIDGPTLAGLMIDFDIGVTGYRSYVLKRLDSDFFET
ncbi:MAG: restriction endonuclease [Pirellulaceae bacterium]|nr:restriction endonuclease [Pirellulaceae bacterium]